MIAFQQQCTGFSRENDPCICEGDDIDLVT